MTSRQLNQALARATGATCCQCAKPSPVSVSTRCLFCREPHARAYTSDLNAVHGLESTLTDEQWVAYERHLNEAQAKDHFYSTSHAGLVQSRLHISARTRAECILEALTTS